MKQTRGQRWRAESMSTPQSSFVSTRCTGRWSWSWRLRIAIATRLTMPTSSSRHRRRMRWPYKAPTVCHYLLPTAKPARSPPLMPVGEACRHAFLRRRWQRSDASSGASRRISSRPSGPRLAPAVTKSARMWWSDFNAPVSDSIESIGGFATSRRPPETIHPWRASHHRVRDIGTSTGGLQSASNSSAQAFRSLRCSSPNSARPATAITCARIVAMDRRQDGWPR